MVMIDNYDSFTYNLVQYFGELGANVKVFRNDKVSLDEIKRIKPDHIVISPGPGRPRDAGISKDVVLEFYKHIPILGVCLGHQAIAEVFGAKIIRAKRLMHGKTSSIYHNGKDLFDGVSNPFEATRYHSLIVKPDTISSVFTITAETEDKEIMGIKYKRYPLFGVQFHPESILTSVGHDILNNFLQY
ncbi:MAG: aminodeoxychorismate/anthranilate synthase component II [Candidatus Kaelpia imicola]|nr:aminodeoxychorismate/anthranilate synthase component II [Candidatus Kaelpia imicola]